VIDVWHLRRVNWLRELPPDAAKRLQESSSVLEVEAGDVVFSPSRQPGHVYLLENGLIRMFRLSASGGEITLGFVREGEVFGELTIFSEEPRESFAQAVQSSHVWRIPRSVFIDVLHSSPSVLFEVSKQVGGRFKRIESRAEDLVFRDVRSRRASILIELARDFGVSQADGSVEIDFPLTQADLGLLVGATRQTVSMSFAELRQEGLVGRGGRRIVVRQPDALGQLAKAVPVAVS
jgi:CRP/FNR family cyclic AMP-dependent transcriptional regulator